MIELKTPTNDVARYWAKTGAEVLFAEKDLFDGQVSKEKLEDNLYLQILKNLLESDTSDISEDQLQDCIERSKN